MTRTIPSIFALALGLHLLGTAPALAANSDLEILSLVPSQQSVVNAETFHYTIHVRNAGPDPAQNVRFAAGANHMAFFRGIVAPEGWTCDSNTPLFGYGLTCVRDVLQSQESAEFVVTLAAPQPTAMTYRISAVISSDTPDAQPGNDRHDLSLSLGASRHIADLSLAAKMDGAMAKLEVRNAGPEEAKELTLIIRHDAASPAIRAKGRGWKCGPDASHVVCTRAALSNNTSAPVEVHAPSGEAVVVTARVRSEKSYDPKRNETATITLPPPSTDGKAGGAQPGSR